MLAIKPQDDAPMPLADAVGVLKKFPPTKFDQTVEIHMRKRSGSIGPSIVSEMLEIVESWRVRCAAPAGAFASAWPCSWWPWWSWS